MILGRGSPEALQVREAFSKPIGKVLLKSSWMWGLMITERTAEDWMRPALFSAIQVYSPASCLSSLDTVRVPVAWSSFQPGI